MATLVPNEISPGARVPRAERELLEGLRSERHVSRDWVVLHSLDIRRHVTKLEGEADFVVIAPGLGILCVEVKGCDVRRQGGKWHYMYDPPKVSSESPFKQSHTAMYSLKRELDRLGADEMDGKIFASCVVFTEIDFRETSVEWNSWESISRPDISAHGIAECLKRSLEAEHRHIRSQQREGKKAAGWYDGVRSRPSADQCERLLARLRRDFGYEGSRTADVQRAEQAIAHFTDEQVQAALGASGNPRVVFKGAAGTGKTFLALHLARMWAAEGLKVGLICFNTRLGRWLAAETVGELGEGGFAGTFHSLLVEATDEKVPSNPTADYWNALPSKALEKMVESDTSPQFDVLIVDEAQDLLKNQDLVDVLDLTLKNGLAAGRWVFMGDFARQAIFSVADGEQDLLERLNRRGVQTATYSLTNNCRNSQRVASNITILGGLTPGYPRTLNADVLGKVSPYFVDGAGAQARKLSEVLMALRKTYQPQQIVVLSPLAESCASTLAKNVPQLGLVPLPLSGPTAGKTGYCTIQSFKGMESPVVIITDIRGWVSEQDEALFYVGLSRAKLEAHLIMDTGLQAAFQQRVLRG